MLMTTEIEKREVTLSHKEAIEARDEIIWQQLELMTVERALSQWLATLSAKTRDNYNSGMKKLSELGLIQPAMSLQAFALVNHDATIDRIKLVDAWSECTRQARAACYISFTNFLNRRSQDIIKRARPSREGTSKTFSRVYEEVKTKAMTQAQWMVFLKELEGINPRDCLIAKLTLQGGKRINEVLSLSSTQIDWQEGEVSFKQSKTRGLNKETVITYPDRIMAQLKEYLGGRSGHVFVTRTGKPVMITQLASSFKVAGKLAGIPFKVTPHVLRASTVTHLKQSGFSDSDIMKVTGHASSEMVNAYDKSSKADNATKKICLV